LENDAKPDEEWIFVLCHGCGRPVLLTPISADMLDENGDLTLRAGSVRATCPHCQIEATYRPEELRRGRAKQKP